MYQQNQYNSNYSNQYTRNFQNGSSTHQQNSKPLQPVRSPFGNPQTKHEYQQSHGLGNQLPKNQLSPALMNRSATPNNNLHHRYTTVGTEHPNNNMISFAGRVPQLNAQSYLASPGVLIHQNNKNFSMQYQGNTTNENRLRMTKGSSIDKFETESVALVKSLTGERFKKNENEKIRMFTGNPEKILNWHKLYNNYFCFYELIASVLSIQEGTVRLQKVLLLRDKKGPIIQVIHYVNDHVNIGNFFVGQILRCVGHMIGHNILQSISIREATLDEVTTIRRMCYISDHAISKALNKS